MRILFTIAFLSGCNTLFSQQYGLTKYGFGVYYDTTTAPPLPPPIVDTLTEFGVFVLASPRYNTLTKRIDRAVDMGVDVYRYGYTYGLPYNLQQMKDAGLKVELTYNESDNNGINGYVTDTILFKAHLTATLNSATAKPDFICIRNEPGNYIYWDTANPQLYVNELRAATTVANAFGIPISDGGILSNTVYNLWKYYSDNNKTDSVRWLTDITGITNVNGPAAKTSMAWNNTVLTGIASIAGLSYVNLHWYEPFRRDTTSIVTTGLIEPLGRYLMQVTGKSVWSNEFGTKNHSCQLLFLVINDWRKLNPRLLEYFSGDGPDAADNGDCYKAYLQQ